MENKMKKLEKFSLNELTAFLHDNIKNQDEEMFVKKYIHGVIKNLKTNPKLYRSFGPYWWPLKRVILEHHDYDGFLGDSYDATLDQAFRYDTDALTVCAAYNMQQAIVENGYMYSVSHTVYTTDKEQVELVIEDDDIERLIFSMNFS